MADRPDERHLVLAIRCRLSWPNAIRIGSDVIRNRGDNDVVRCPEMGFVVVQLLEQRRRCVDGFVDNMALCRPRDRDGWHGGGGAW